MQRWIRVGLVAGITVATIGSFPNSSASPQVDLAGVGPAHVGPPITTGLPAKQGTRPVATKWLVEHYGKQSMPQTVTWLADSRHVLVSAEHPDAAPTIEVIDVAARKSRMLATGTVPLLSPDRTTVAYVGLDRQLWTVPVAGGKAIRRTGGENTPATVGWGPAGSTLLYALNRTVDPAPVDGTKAKVVDAMLARYTLSDLYLLPLVGGARPRKLKTMRPAIVAITPIPRSADQVLVQTYGGYESDSIEVNTYLDVLSTSTGATRRLLDDPGGQVFAFSPSPNGRQVAFRYARDRIAFPSYADLAIVDLTGGEPRRLTTGAYVTGQVRWSKDGALFFACKTMVFSETCAVPDTEGRRTPNQLHPGRGDATGTEISPDGRWLVRTLDDAYAGRRIETLPVARGKAIGVPRTVRVERATPTEVRLGVFHQVTWKSTDGLALNGLLLLPPDYRPGERLPTVVDIHGGAEGGVRLNGGSLMTTSPMEWQVWASVVSR